MAKKKARRKFPPNMPLLMMIYLYNLLTILLLPLLVLFFLFSFFREKYRSRLFARLGLNLQQQLPGLVLKKGTTIWLHALSVGEVTSALPLIRGMRARFPEASIVCSVSTRSGQRVAKLLLASSCEAIIAAPLDLDPVIRLFCRQIKPSLFLLVETDFWPNWLHVLARAKVPLMLVNGRISARSFAKYQRFSFFFLPMFNTFSRLSMQTKADARKMAALGLEKKKILTLGNLKFDVAMTGDSADFLNKGPAARKEYGFQDNKLLLICGSTHAGEEEILLAVFAALRKTIPDLQLLMAPRNIERASELASLAGKNGLSWRLRSTEKKAVKQVPRHASARATDDGAVLLLDTLGELASCYAMADLAFIGGTLVARGGHNPIEAARVGVAVCFGPHMEDFSEIAEEFIEAGAARQIDEENIFVVFQDLLRHVDKLKAMGQAGRSCVARAGGVVERHLDYIDALIGAQRKDE